MDALYNFYLKLIPDLLKDLVFYIPKSEIVNTSIKEISELNNSLLVDTIFIFDEYQGPMPYSQKTGFKQLISQFSNLEKNIFKLVQKRKDCTDKEFAFVLDKYFTFLRALTYSCEWLYENLNTNQKENKKVESKFYLQLDGLRKHQETLQTTFHLNGELQDLNKINDKTKVKGLITDITANLPKTNIEETSNTNIDEKNNVVDSALIKSKTNRKVLITEAEAEKNLLKTFFGIE